MHQVVEVVAGGKGVRIRTVVDSAVGSGAPKHLLPIPSPGSGQETTILRAVVETALSEFETARVHVREEAVPATEAALHGIDGDVRLRVDHELTGPFGPIAQLLEADQTLSFAGGDAHCQWDWPSLTSFHARHRLPVTTLVAETRASPGGARVVVDRSSDVGGVVSSWERVPTSGPGDLLNIGAYCVDGTPEVLKLLASLPRHTEDAFLGRLAEEGLVAAFVSPHPGFNVNTPDVYKALVDQLTHGDARAV